MAKIEKTPEIASNPQVSAITARFATNRAKKTYSIKIGVIPEKADKVNRFQKHTAVIACAITELVQEGTTSTTRDAIMEKAVSLGLYTEQTSKSCPAYIWSWHLPALKLAGFVN